VAVIEKAFSLVPPNIFVVYTVNLTVIFKFKNILFGIVFDSDIYFEEKVVTDRKHIETVRFGPPTLVTPRSLNSVP
jgi:hypothetical protein